MLLVFLIVPRNDFGTHPREEIVAMHADTAPLQVLNAGRGAWHSKDIDSTDVDAAILTGLDALQTLQPEQRNLSICFAEKYRGRCVVLSWKPLLPIIFPYGNMKHR